MCSPENKFHAKLRNFIFCPFSSFRQILMLLAPRLTVVELAYASSNSSRARLLVAEDACRLAENYS